MIKFIVGFLILLPLAAGADNSGSRWMLMPGSARAIGLAGAGTALKGDLSALKANPAALAGMQGSEAALTHNQWVSDMSSEHLMFGMQAGAKSGLAAGFDYYNFGSIAWTEVSPSGSLNELGEVRPYAMQASLGYGQDLAGGLSLGLAARAMQQKINGSDGNGFAGDVGGLWQAPGAPFTLGVALKNAGSEIASAVLPMQASLGASYTQAFSSARLMLLADMALPLRSGDSGAYSAGVEFGSSVGALRGGYQLGQNGGPSGFAAGASASLGSWGLDYAYNHLGELEATHQLTLSAHFGQGASQPDQAVQQQAMPVSMQASPESSPQALSPTAVP